MKIFKCEHFTLNLDNLSAIAWNQVEIEFFMGDSEEPFKLRFPIGLGEGARQDFRDQLEYFLVYDEGKFVFQQWETHWKYKSKPGILNLVEEEKRCQKKF